MFSHASIRGWAKGLAFSALLALAAPAGADSDPEYVGRTPPRLSLVEGEVSFFRAGSADWEEAQTNLPLAPGDYLFSGPGSRLEVQIGPRAFLRAASDTQVGVEAQDGGLLRLDLSQGRLALDLRDLQAGARVELETPHAKLAVSAPGLYDVTVSESRSSFVARQGGRATVLTGNDSMELRAGGEVVADAAGSKLARFQAPPPGDWDLWNSERTDRILSATSRGYVSDDIYGLNDLDAYGTWREAPQYGRVWVPSSVGAGWAPYTNGRWLWDGDYGWTWVDAAPWGWAPYHYGRWVWVGSYWGWAPGPLVVAPLYAPALVAFFGNPGFSVSVGIGVPFVSWVALGWGEPVFPWWGPAWYRGRPCWDGWGGPTIINNVYVNPRHGWHGGKPDHFHNQDVPNAVVRVRRDDFARRSTERLSLAAAEQRKLRPVHDRLPVEPSEVGVNTRPTRGRPPRPGGGVDTARPGPHQDGGRDPRRVSRDSIDPRLGTRPPSPYGRGSEDVGGTRPERRGAEGVGAARPERPVPSRSRPDTAEAGVRPSRPERPLPPRSRPESADGSVRPSRSLPARPDSPRVARDSTLGARPTRPNPPTRPLPDRPQRPSAPSNYTAPSYDRFDRAPRQQQAPRPEMPVRNAPRVDPPTRPMPGSAPAPRQRSGADYGSRSFQRPSSAVPSQPQSSGGGFDRGGSRAPAPNRSTGSPHGGGVHRGR